MNEDKILYYYIFDKNLLEVSKNIPNIGNRAVVVNSLIASYNLLSNCKVYSSKEATEDNLLSFHSMDYIEFLKKINASTDLEKLIDSDECTNFNLCYDCPIFSKMFDFAKLIAGSSLTAAKILTCQNLRVKKTLVPVVIQNSRPKSYLKMKSISNDTYFKNDSTVEDKYCNILTNETNKKVKREEGQIRKYGTEVFLSPFINQPIAINWFGGWHHAQRDEAGGFCYINDIVIAILYLLKFFKKILYIDLDIHHGNGVENAFLFSPKVLTFSIHKFEPGFYPATGSINDIGEGTGKYYSVNVPLKDGITDTKYTSVFKPIFSKIMKKYKPECVVIQCGADCLAGDPLGGFNLTPRGMGDCLKSILREKLPTLILGGGGYNIINTSKCWTYLMSIILNQPVSNDIPEHEFLHLYGPEFELNVKENLRKDENTEEYLQHVLEVILKNLENL